MSTDDSVGGDILHETEQGVYGLEGVVADFDPAQLSKLRRIAAEIQTKERPGVRAAIALAGSAAQSRFQLFPGDCDFFERVHIEAATREEAIEGLAMLMVQTVAHVLPHPELQFVEMLFGLHPIDSTRGEDVYRAGSPVSWKLNDLDARVLTVQGADGEPHAIELVANAHEPGFVKLDWVFADHEEDRIVAVSKVIDATWGTPDGQVVPLDGVLDSFYQEVYLDPESKEDVERLIDEVRPDGLEHYVGQLEKEIRKYTQPGHENYGKVAKRLYNIFRITNRAAPAAFLRQLFDDPPARLYQVPATLYALSSTLGTRRLAPKVLAAQIEGLGDILRTCYAGDDCQELIGVVESLPDLQGDGLEAALARVSDAANQQVSDYFEQKLAENDEIRGYLTEVAQAG